MILYIGNKLSKHGFTPTNVETLGPKLQNIFDVFLISDKKNKIHRFLDAIIGIIKHRKKLELVIIDTYSTSNFYYTLVSAILCQVFKIKYIPILHGGGLPDRLANSPGLSRSVFGKAYRNISPSHYLMEAFQKHGFQVDYIPNYIDTEIYPTRIRENVQPSILYVRSFHKIYNPEMAIKVLKQLSEKFVDVKLCMVGPNKDGTKESVEKLADELGVREKLQITGKLSKEEWIALSDDYDIFINTTNFDNLPVSIIEAMCLGFPIVSTNAGGLPYLIKDKVDGILVNINDDTAMTQAITEILTNKSFAESMSKAAYKKGLSFDWNAIEPQWIKLIENAGIKRIS